MRDTCAGPFAGKPAPTPGGGTSVYDVPVGDTPGGDTRVGAGLPAKRPAQAMKKAASYQPPST
ncbi:hypothetical protein PRJ_4009 [Pseudomonas sp. XWY-1]|nr:hypothetical protein PRJ_4009 [Pseudomonas sp. XWY-1]